MQHSFVVRNWAHFRTQSSFLTMSGKVHVDFVGRFENLNDDVHSVMRDMGIKRDDVPHENKTKKKDGNRIELSNDSVNILLKLYSEDFKNFGYK